MGGLCRNLSRVFSGAEDHRITTSMAPRDATPSPVDMDTTPSTVDMETTRSWAEMGTTPSTAEMGTTLSPAEMVPIYSLSINVTVAGIPSQTLPLARTISN